jgi:SAM-dependent methyltransferase
MSEKHEILGWGKVNNEGSEIWDTNPVFLGDTVTTKDWLKLMFYPKKFLLYRWIRKEQKAMRKEQTIFRVLDVGCGTGASVIDLKKIFGRGADVVGAALKCQKSMGEPFGHMPAVFCFEIPSFKPCRAISLTLLLKSAIMYGC